MTNNDLIKLLNSSDIEGIRKFFKYATAKQLNTPFNCDLDNSVLYFLKNSCYCFNLIDDILQNKLIDWSYCDINKLNILHVITQPHFSKFIAHDYDGMKKILNTILNQSNFDLNALDKHDSTAFFYYMSNFVCNQSFVPRGLDAWLECQQLKVINITQNGSNTFDILLDKNCQKNQKIIFNKIFNHISFTPIVSKNLISLGGHENKIKYLSVLDLWWYVDDRKDLQTMCISNSDLKIILKKFIQHEDFKKYINSQSYENPTPFKIKSSNSSPTSIIFNSISSHQETLIKMACHSKTYLFFKWISVLSKDEINHLLNFRDDNQSNYLTYWLQSSLPPTTLKKIIDIFVANHPQALFEKNSNHQTVIDFTKNQEIIDYLESSMITIKYKSLTQSISHSLTEKNSIKSCEKKNKI